MEKDCKDIQFTYAATLCAQNYYYLADEYLYHNRIVGNSLSRGYTKNMWNLYKLLIEDLYEETQKFKELDLMNQMHLRAFFCVLDSIENEMKPTCPNDHATRVRLISEIMNDEICSRFHGKIPTDILNSLYQDYYKLIENKDAEGIFKATKKYKNRMVLKRFFRSIVGFISENKWTGNLYKIIRKR